MQERDPYFFPFVVVKQNELIPGNQYYMNFSDKYIKMYTENKSRLPVTRLKGIFVRIHDEIYPGPKKFTKRFAVFKNVFIISASPNPVCRFMFVRQPDGSLGSDSRDDSCNSYSNKLQNRIVNTDREVYLDETFWKFGMSSEGDFLRNQVVRTPILPEELQNEIRSHTTQKNKLGGRKSRRRKTRRSKRSKKSKSKRRR
jgi:hypothetical protein